VSVIKIDKFLGSFPGMSKRLLSKYNSGSAIDCRLTSGDLKPLDGMTVEWTPTKVGAIKTIYKFANSFWFHWTTDVDVVRSPIISDTQERTYFTGDGVPKVTDATIATSGVGTDYPNNSFTLGVPAPAAAATLALVGTPATDPADNVSRAYVYTYVTPWGEEGPPSPVSAVVDVGPLQTVDLSLMSVSPGGSYNLGASAVKRIYRAITGSSGTAYLFVAEIPIANTSFSDVIMDTSLGEAIQSTDWDAPPANMAGITIMPNGIGVGFSGKELCISVNYQLHAWPINYRLATDYPIVGLSAFGNSLLVATTGNPYIAIGTDGSSMTLVKLELNQACVSKRGIVDLGDVAVYPSPDGLVAVSTGGVRLATEGVIDRTFWDAFSPDTMQGYMVDGKYVGFYDTGTIQGGFIFDPSSSDNPFTFLTAYADAGFNNLIEDILYLQVGADIVKFDDDTANPLTYSWASKKFITPKPINMGAARVLSNVQFGGTLDFTLSIDGVIQHTQAIVDSEPFRLPSGYLGKKIVFSLAGTARVEEITVAETMAELQMT